MAKIFSKNTLVVISEIIIIIILGIFSSLQTLFPFCHLYQNSDFDSQALLFWDYAASKHIPIYSKIFFPYGIFTYLRNENIFIHYSYTAVYIFILLICFLTLKKLWKNYLYSLISFASFYIFISFFTGEETVVRYGILLMFSLLIANVSTNKSKIIKIFGLGLLSGILSFLIPDQGIYSIVTFLIFTLVSPFFGLIFKPAAYLREIIASFLTFAAGLFLGLLLFLISIGSQPVLYNLKFINDLSKIAKTPFIPSFHSHENIFTIIILLMIVTFLSYIKLFGNKVNPFLCSLFLSVTISLLLLEQKNIIRSIDTQITFFAFLLLILLSYQAKEIFNKLKIKSQYQALLFITAFIAVFFLSGFHKDKPLGVPSSSIKTLSECVEENKKNLLTKNPEYDLVLKFLQSQPDFNGKIFSFPGDPLFYVLFNQTLPYYSQIYDGSSFSAQQTAIDYIESQKIKYIVINTKIKAIEDGVPDYLRVPYELKYILNNFNAIRYEGNFLILRKSDQSFDFFKNSVFNQNPDFKNYLLSVNLGYIPRSEGIYKYKLIQPYAKKNELNSLDNLNFYTENSLLIMIMKETKTEKISLSLTDSEGNQTKIIFQRCKLNFPCIIHLSQIPLFYKNKIIKKIIPADKSIPSFIFIPNADIKYFW